MWPPAKKFTLSAPPQPGNGPRSLEHRTKKTEKTKKTKKEETTRGGGGAGGEPAGAGVAAAATDEVAEGGREHPCRTTGGENPTNTVPENQLSHEGMNA